MIDNIEIQKPSTLLQDKKRRRREVIMIIAIIIIVSVLTYAENQIIHFGTDIPVSNTILMFILININILLLTLLIFLVIPICFPELGDCGIYRTCCTCTRRTIPCHRNPGSSIGVLVPPTKPFPQFP